MEKKSKPIYPSPTRSECILISAKDPDMKELVSEFISCRKKYAEKSTLASWKEYYSSLRSLYLFYRNIPLKQRLKLAPVEKGHGFHWDLDKNNTWCELDLSFEFICCIQSGVSLIGLVCTSTDLEEMERTIDVYRQAISDLDLLSRVCKERNRDVAAIAQQKAIYSTCTIILIFKQILVFFRFLVSIDIKSEYSEREMTDFVTANYDSILSHYMGLFVVREVFNRAVPHMERVARVDEKVTEAVEFRCNEARAIVNFLTFFVPALDKSRQYEKLPTVVDQFEELYEKNIKTLAITNRIWKFATVYSETVKNRRNNRVYILIESQGLTLGMSKSIDDYIEKKSINPKISL
jgi:hypothetical protein